MASISTAARNAAADAFTARVNSGSIRLYSGTPPADVNAALSGNTLLATVPLAATAYGAAANGQAALAGTPRSDTNAAASGTATFYRIHASAGAAEAQGTVGTTGAELNLSSTSIVAGGTVTINGHTYTQSGG